MEQEFTTLTIPLERNAQGVIRISGTRVSLDSVLYAYFEDGATAEEIVLRYPTCKLEDIYTVLSWVLHHPNIITEYLTEQSERRERAEYSLQPFTPDSGLRARLLARSRKR